MTKAGQGRASRASKMEDMLLWWGGWGEGGMFLAVVSFLLRGMMVVLLLALLIAKTGQPFRWLLLPCGQRTRLQTG